MKFDKTKAMRSAERFLSQGKIRAAINEYQRVVENDPKDFSTLNILGDLHAKDFNKQEAVGCFTQVAEHYNNQGFSHKAIAIYNKIFRIEPQSVEVSLKLAELYHSKGSVAEARKHYQSLAEQYQKKGKKIQALTIWKQLAELDPHNTEIYLTLAEAFYQENQMDEAASSFTEAGLRFNKQENYESSLPAFAKALEIRKNDARALKGLVKAQIGLGNADEAAQTLEKVLAEQPYNREILYLLADCYLEAGNAEEAETAIFKLVEQDPANHTKFLELVKLYLKNSDLDAAVRILAHSAEHLLIGGEAEKFLEWTNEILARNPERTDALRLMVQYYGWQRDPEALKISLERLVETARATGDIEGERYALSQLVLTAPKSETTKRLQEINTAQGYAAETAAEADGYFDAADFETFAPVDEQTSEEAEEAGEANDDPANVKEFSFADVKGAYDFESNGAARHVENNGHSASAEAENAVTPPKSAGSLKLSDKHKLEKELESIEFYIEQDYHDLAAKALEDLAAEYGEQPQIIEWRARLLESASPMSDEIVSETESANEKKRDEKKPESEKLETLDELNSELDVEETASVDIADQYETHYHLATAYKGMGLLEDAIREFQDAINLVEINDGTRRFFQCSNLLGHCFLEKQMPNLAVIWYRRSLEMANLMDEEKHALYYEIANAFEVSGETKSSFEYFEKLYAEDVNYRDVGRRLKNLRA